MTLAWEKTICPDSYQLMNNDQVTLVQQLSRRECSLCLNLGHPLQWDPVQGNQVLWDCFSFTQMIKTQVVSLIQNAIDEKCFRFWSVFDFWNICKKYQLNTPNQKIWNMKCSKIWNILSAKMLVVRAFFYFRFFN